MDKYNPEVGELWWFGDDKKHYLFLSKNPPPESHSSYKWMYRLYCIETGNETAILHGNMNAYGEGWFRRIS